MNRQLRIAVLAMLSTVALGMGALGIHLLGTASPRAGELHRRSLARLLPASGRSALPGETLLAQATTAPSQAGEPIGSPALPNSTLSATTGFIPERHSVHNPGREVPPVAVTPDRAPGELVSQSIPGPQRKESIGMDEAAGLPPHARPPAESMANRKVDEPPVEWTAPVRIAARKPLSGLLDEQPTTASSTLPESITRSTVARLELANQPGPEPAEPQVDRVPPVPSAIHLETPQRSDVELRIASLESAVRRLADARSETSSEKALDRATQMLERLQQSQQLNEIERRLQGLQIPAPGGAGQGQSAGNATTGPQPSAPVIPSSQPILKAHPSNEMGDHFSLQIQDTEVREVLDVLGQMSGMNIVASSDVKGTVSANLKNVTIEEALQAILRSLGYVHEQENEFIYVMTAEQAKARKTQRRSILTRVYRPHYVSVKELQSLMTPLLTPEIGRIAVTSPAQSGIASSPGTAGGDEFAQTDALLVQDYQEVVEQLDKILLEIDIPPMQVVIEAMILSVKLNDSMQFGVNFALLGGAQNGFATSGSGATLNSSVGFPDGTNQNILPLGDFLADTAGLKYGFIRDNVSGFIEALETIADTNLIASPQLRVLNKQKAELIIGERLSYKTLAFNGTQTVENVNFLDSGTKLLLRPYISPDGLVRLEVHPERSSATLDANTGLPNQSTTEVTTNIMVHDGMTVVIGGLIEEQTVESMERIPFLGALPVVGAAFRNKTERIDRTELIVLITPRIVIDPVAGQVGEVARNESDARRDHFQEHLSPVGRRNLSRMHYERASDLYEKGKLIRAREHAKLALQHSKNDRDALLLKEIIDAELHSEVMKYVPFVEQTTDPTTLQPQAERDARAKTLGTTTPAEVASPEIASATKRPMPAEAPGGSPPTLQHGVPETAIESEQPTATNDGQIIPPPRLP